MRRKNFILTVLIFLFVNILSIAVENPTTLSDSLGLVDPTYQEALKDYKPNLENIDKIFNYIEKNIKNKGRAIFYSKLEKEKNQIIVTDENNNVIFAEKIPEKLTEMIPYFECKEIYQLKNGKRQDGTICRGHCLLFYGIMKKISRRSDNYGKNDSYR